MDCLTSKETINNTVEAVSDVSYAEKKEALTTHEEINQFLDNILELKQVLAKKTATVNHINLLLERVSWLNDVNEECLKLLNILIGVGRDFHSTLLRQYYYLHSLESKGIAIQSIDEFKDSMDTLTELIDDLESAFFSLPKMPEFAAVTKQLSLL
jgi:hypothetical protein